MATQIDETASDKLYYRIGEVSKLTGVKPYVLRYWESEFRWMAPQKSRSKQRLYRKKDIEMVLLIKRLLHEERYTIAGARRKLRDMGIGKALEPEAEKLTQAAEDCAELLGVDDGLETVLGMIGRALPEHLRETAYVLACDVAAADLSTEQEELRLLEMLRNAVTSWDSSALSSSRNSASSWLA